MAGRFQAFLGQKEFLAEMCLGLRWLDCAYPFHRPVWTKHPEMAYAILRFSQLSARAVFEGYVETQLSGRWSVLHSPAPTMYGTAASCLGFAENLCIALDVLPC